MATPPTPARISGGILAVAKPCGPTSHDIVAAARRRLGERGIGHAGTLDPLASGLLVLLIGRARRLQDLVQARPKAYRATIVLGATSATDDAEGPITPRPSTAPLPERAAIEAALGAFVGRIAQRPPAFSAVHAAGTRAWKMARRGQAVELPAREVEVSAIEIVSYRPPELVCDIRCGKGTYVRSIARDLGEALGTGAYLGALERTMSAGLLLADAVAPEAMGWDVVRPIAGVLAAEPRVDLDESWRTSLVGGKTIALSAPVPAPGAGGALFAWIGGQPIAWIVATEGGIRSRALLAE